MHCCKRSIHLIANILYLSYCCVQISILLKKKTYFVEFLSYLKKIYMKKYKKKKVIFWQKWNYLPFQSLFKTQRVVRLIFSKTCSEGGDFPHTAIALYFLHSLNTVLEIMFLWMYFFVFDILSSNQYIYIQVSISYNSLISYVWKRW